MRGTNGLSKTSLTVTAGGGVGLWTLTRMCSITQTEATIARVRPIVRVVDGTICAYSADNRRQRNNMKLCLNIDVVNECSSERVISVTCGNTHKTQDSRSTCNDETWRQCMMQRIYKDLETMMIA